MCDTKREKMISLEHLLHFDPYKVFPPTAVQQVFARGKLSEPVPATFFAGKHPLVSDLSDRCVWSSSVDSDFDCLCSCTVPVLIFALYLCVCVQEMAEVTVA